MKKASATQIARVATLASGTILMNGFLGTTDEAEKIAANLGVGLLAIKGVAGIVSNLVPGYIAEAIKEIGTIAKHDINHDLEKAILSSYEETFKLILQDLSKDYDLREGFFERLKKLHNLEISDKTVFYDSLRDQYFPRLKRLLTDPELVSEAINKHHLLSPGNYIKQVIAKVTTHSFANLALDDKLDLQQYVTQKFAQHYPIAFSKQLKKSPEAKTVYFKMLLELGIARIDAVKQDTQSIKATIKQLKSLTAQLRIDFTDFQEKLTIRLPQDFNYAQILDKHTFFNELAILKENLAQQSIWTPELTCFKEAERPDNIFNYKTQFTDFHGRNEELSQLIDFLESEETFSWWNICGEGGSGKSRLALELCYIAREIGYDAGFYDVQAYQSENNKTLSLAYDMLMVIDYSQADNEKTKSLLKYLHNKINTEAQKGINNTTKIRILLIDRAFGEEWQHQSASFITSLYKEQALALKSLSKDEQWALVKEITTKTWANSKDKNQKPIKVKSEEQLELMKEEILIEINSSNNQGLPLFVLLISNAIAIDGKAKSWSVNNLVHNIISRLENEYWSKYAKYEHYQNEVKIMLCANTILREISHSDLKFICDELFAFSRKEKEEFLGLYSAISLKNKEYKYRGIQPDILGSYFIGKQLLTKLNLGEERDFFDLIEICRKFKSEATTWSLILFASDFIDTIDDETHETLKSSVKEIYFLKPELLFDESYAIYETRLLIQLCQISGYTHEESIKIHIPSIKKIADHPLYQADENIAYHYLIALYNLLTQLDTAHLEHIQTQVFPEMLRIFHREAFQSSQRICYLVSSAIYNFTIFVCEQPVEKHVMYIFEFLWPLEQQITEKHPTDLVIAQNLFKTMRFSLNIVIPAHDVSICYKHITQVLSRFPEDEILADEYCQILSRIIWFEQTPTEIIQEALHPYLMEVFFKFAKKIDIVYWATESSYNFMVRCNNEKDYTGALRMAELILALCKLPSKDVDKIKNLAYQTTKLFKFLQKKQLL